MTEVYLGQLSPACAPSRTRNSIEVLLQISGSHPLLLREFLVRKTVELSASGCAASCRHLATIVGTGVWPKRPAPLLLLRLAEPSPPDNSCSQNAHRNSRTRDKTGHHRVPNALKRKDWPSLDCAHNPKVGGSNPSPAIRAAKKRPFFIVLGQ